MNPTIIKETDKARFISYYDWVMLQKELGCTEPLHEWKSKKLVAVSGKKQIEKWLNSSDYN